MLRLTSTTEKIQAVLSGAITTTQPQAVVCYSDQTTGSYAGGKQVTALNSTTDVDILAAPAASTIRDVDYISIFNRDSASITVTVKYDISATDSIIITVTLQTLETLQYVHGSGWACIDAQGRFKTGASFSGTLTAANGGTGFSSYTVGDILYADTSSTLAKLSDVATGNALISGGIGVAPSWGKVGLTTHVSGTLPVANGGTGLTAGTSGGILGFTASGTIASSSLLTANGIVIGGGAGATPSSTAAMTDGQLLIGQSSAAPLPKTISGNATLAASGALTVTGASGLFDISGASAGQIKFPATQNQSAGANVLDDYEEGTFTPGISFGGGSTGITYSAQVGVYTKIGNTANLGIRVVLTSKGSSTGQALVTGLPFTQANITNGFFGFMFGGSSFSVAVNSCQGAQNPNTTTLFLQSITAGSATVLTDVEFTNTSALNLNGCIFT